MGTDENTVAFGQMGPEKMLEKLLHYKELYERECEEFEEYKSSSQEMEQMMEGEIEGMKKELRELQREKHKADVELDRVQNRHEHEKREYLKIEETLRREVDELRTERTTLKSRVRDLEQKNDDLERGGRNNHQLLEDLEKKLNDALERTAILECELAEKQMSAEEVYRLREELKYSRPRMAVEPLRVVPPQQHNSDDQRPSSSSAADAKPGIEATKQSPECTTVSQMDTSDGVGVSKPHVSIPSYVNMVLKDLLLKMDRFEGILKSIKNPQPSQR